MISEVALMRIRFIYVILIEIEITNKGKDFDIPKDVGRD